jgi:hypothetical protein
VHQLLRTLTCASLIAFTGVIGVGMLTAVAIKLQVVTPAALLCGVKSWLNQECGPKPENTEMETAAEVDVAPTTEQPVEDSPHLIGAEPSREISEIAVAPPQEEPAARETQYNVASAQTEILGSRAVLREKASGSEQPEQPLATEKGGASKQASGRRDRQETIRRALAKRNDQRRLNVVARETLHDVPVNISDRTQRRIDIRPTSLQDVYYYSAPR